MEKRKFPFSAERRKKICLEIDKRLAILKTQVQAVGEGYTSALFVFGPGGLGKTHEITNQLDGLVGKAWCHHTAYTTPKALMLALASSPDSIHLFEDCENLYKADVAASILRAACGSPRQKDRWVTYETAHENLRVLFSGGVIIVTNEDISRSKGPLAAVASRFRPVCWNLSIEERAVQILEIAGEGWKKGNWVINPDDCGMVADWLVEQMMTGQVLVPVDLRTFVEHALPAYAQWRAGSKEVSWQDVMTAKLQGSLRVEENRPERAARLEAIALNIWRDGPTKTEAKIAQWHEQTGLGQAIYYRHLRAAKNG